MESRTQSRGQITNNTNDVKKPRVRKTKKNVEFIMEIKFRRKKNTFHIRFHWVIFVLIKSNNSVPKIELFFFYSYRRIRVRFVNSV